MCEGKEYDDKSDIWALGCVLGEMCCRLKTFTATNLSELVKKIMAVSFQEALIILNITLEFVSFIQ